jgi:FtsP/CotA-like multicopper oxidase with cupredoxin domain
MRLARAIPLVAVLAVQPGTGLPSAPSILPIAGPNANTAAAGVLRNGVLTISLDATMSAWHPNGDSLPGKNVEAFAETGKRPLVPGPLIRVPAGTEIRATVRNTLIRDTLNFRVPGTIHGAAAEEPADSVVVPPGETRELRVRATVPGNYSYRATTGTPVSTRMRLGGLLTGALIVDTAGRAGPPRDRVFVLLWSVDTLTAAGQPSGEGMVFAVNGRSWPRTERLSATVGDTLRWRIINASADVHPMHLHGFYYRVDAFTGPLVARDGQGAAGRMVVTERMSAFSTMSMTWIPERGGNWLFHCHFQLHVVPNQGPAGAVVQQQGHAHSDKGNHAETGMGGLVLGVAVAPKRGERIATPGPGIRKVRMIAVADSGFSDSLPSMRFVIEERQGPGAALRRADAGPGFSPPLNLVKDEAVSITVVNRLREATAVHWHGMELESYYDGVAGLSGFGARVAPLLAPGDSFEARFTPPRSGTFMYHAHASEPRQHRAGLIGSMIVRDPPPPPPGLAARIDDHTFFIKAPLAGRAVEATVEINGSTNPDTVRLHTGRPARLRFISLAITNPNATVFLTTRPDSSRANLIDTMVVQWRPIAKDGADLPGAARLLRLARQIVGMGETYDFEFIPPKPGLMRIEVRGAGPAGFLLARVPIKVE